jgi:acyl carrier protein
MGLDSVDLLVRFEREFKKEAPDKVAEEMYTVGDVANWFYHNLTIQMPEKNLKEEIFDLVKNTFRKLKLSEDLTFTQQLHEVIPKENVESIWKKLEENLQLKMPKINGMIDEIKILGVSLYKPKPKTSILECDFERFIECIGAMNYQKLVNFEHITSKFEIEMAVMGITYDQIGVDIEEIFLDSSFTKDLGVD